MNVKELQAKLEAAEADLATANSANETLATEAATAQTERDEANTAKDKAEADLAEANTAKDKSEADLAEANAAKDAAEGKVTELQTDFDDKVETEAKAKLVTLAADAGVPISDADQANDDGSKTIADDVTGENRIIESTSVAGE